MRVWGFYTKYHFKTFEKEFGANFEFSSRPDLNTPIWFKIKYPYASKKFPYNSFLCAAYPLAAYLNENLYFEGNTSTKLSTSLKKTNQYLGLHKNKVLIKTQNRETSKNYNTKKGLFFTLGLDSFHSLTQIKHHLDYLIFINGFDVYPKALPMIDKINRGLKEVSRFCHCKHLIISTNLRYDLSEKFFPWTLYHGAALAASGYIVNDLAYIHISGSDQYRNPIFWGTGKKLDRLWSSENLSFIPVAANKSRLQKINDLVNNRQYWPLISNYLRVCWQNFGDIDAFNCLKCEKCLRTYIGLKLGGYTGQLDTFNGINLTNIKYISLNQEKLFIWQEMLETIKSKCDLDHDLNQCSVLISQLIHKYQNNQPHE